MEKITLCLKVSFQWLKVSQKENHYFYSNWSSIKIICAIPIKCKLQEQSLELSQWTKVSIELIMIEQFQKNFTVHHCKSIMDMLSSVRWQEVDMCHQSCFFHSNLCFISHEVKKKQKWNFKKLLELNFLK